MKRSLLPLALVVLVALAVAVVALPGCGTKPPKYTTTESDRADEQPPWTKVATPLRKDSDTPSCRQTLTQLNNDLAAKPAPDLQPESLSPDAEKALREALALKDIEVKEIRTSSFGGLDPHYLAECLYLADVARSLGVEKLPPARQAELAFLWVCRQVMISPWILEFQDTGKGVVTVVPSVYVLRRGSGSGLERAYVYLGLLQQLGLDGCLVAGPDTANRVGSPVFNLNEPIPQGPFWAVGARVGGDVVLFDPWRGEPIPGPDGRVATLAQVRANPDLLKPWRDDKAKPWTGGSVDAVKGATAYLTAPLSGLAPRFRRLEQELKSELPVKLAVDPLALKTRFVAETKLADAKLWNPPGDAYSVTRALGSFFSTEKGGFAASDQMHDDYIVRLIPRTVFTVPAELLPHAEGELDLGVPEAWERLVRLSAGVFAGSFIAPPNPREQIHRGHFAQVTSTLVGKRKGYATAQQRVQTDRTRSSEIANWSKKVRAVYERKTKARGANNPVELADAEHGVDLFWKNEAGIANVIVDSAVAEAGLAEATYLLALCMHEQAERAQAKLERLTADPREKANVEKARKEAIVMWGEAKGWWTLYEQGPGGVQDKTYPGRAAHAKRLAAQAAARVAELGAR